MRKLKRNKLNNKDIYKKAHSRKFSFPIEARWTNVCRRISIYDVSSSRNEFLMGEITFDKFTRIQDVTISIYSESFWNLEIIVTIDDIRYNYIHEIGYKTNLLTLKEIIIEV